MKPKKMLLILMAAMMTFAFTSCQDNERRESDDRMRTDSIRLAEESRMEQERMERENNSVHAMVQQDTTLTTFSRNIETNQLARTFREEEGPYTVFAPSNVAYNELSEEERNQFQDSQNMQENNARMFYLVVDEELTSDELREEIEAADGSYTLRTMQGEEITATMQGEDIILTDGAGNTATLSDTDRDASNGVIHVIDGILEPTDVSTNAAAEQVRNTNMNNMNNDNTGNMTNDNTGNRNNDNTGNMTNDNTGNRNNTNNNTLTDTTGRGQ